MDITRINVLYVDDEFLNLRSFELLFKEKFKIYTATNGFDAIEILKKNNVSVIISDQRMPKISGVELLRQVKELKLKNILPIIHSGFLEDKEVQNAIEEGTAKYCLDKPLNEFKLIEIIEEFAKSL
ncbi:MAG: response regulator [Spirochaetes bacterium]|nr:response regulator [Spirochaetota bacterium]